MVEKGRIYYVTTIYVNFLDGVKYRRKTVAKYPILWHF